MKTKKLLFIEYDLCNFDMLKNRDKHIFFLTALFLSFAVFLCSCSDNDKPSPPPPPVVFQSKIGIAPYAIQSPRFNCDAFIASLSRMKAYSISWLWGTFGSESACLERVWQDSRLRAVQVHLMNEVCVRNRNCGNYEILHGLSASRISELAEREEGWFMNRIRDYSQGAALYLSQKRTQRPDIECLISPGLESNTSAAGMEKIISLLRPLFPGCKFVFNELNSNANLAGAELIEGHNPFIGLPSPCVFNNDGDSINFPGLPAVFTPNFDSSKISEINHRFQNCERIFFWTHEHNCIVPGRFIDPRQRLCDQSRSFGLLGAELGSLQGN